MTIFWLMVSLAIGLFIMHLILKYCLGSSYRKEGLVMGLSIGLLLFTLLLGATSIIDAVRPYTKTQVITEEINDSVFLFYKKDNLIYVIYKETETRNEMLIIPIEDIEILTGDISSSNITYTLNTKEENHLAHEIFPWAFDVTEKAENYVLFLSTGTKN